MERSLSYFYFCMQAPSGFKCQAKIGPHVVFDYLAHYGRILYVTRGSTQESTDGAFVVAIRGGAKESLKTYNNIRCHLHDKPTWTGEDVTMIELIVTLGAAMHLVENGMLRWAQLKTGADFNIMPQLRSSRRCIRILGTKFEVERGSHFITSLLDASSRVFPCMSSPSPPL